MFKNILLPVDGSPGSAEVIAKAVAMARAFDAKLILLAIVDPYPFTVVGPEMSYGFAQYKTAARRFASSTIEAARRAIQPPSLLEGSAIIESHIVWKGILQAAESYHTDLLVMGSHGKRRLQHLVLGSVTQQVLQHTNLPVLVVHSAEGRQVDKSYDPAHIWRGIKEASERIVHQHRRG